MSINPGDKFGKLTAIEFSRRTKKHLYWKFKCDCGQDKITRASEVKNQSVKSCGCLQKEWRKFKPSTTKKPEGIASRNALEKSYQRNAIARNLEYKLTKEEFNILTKGNCVYCGIEPQQKVSNKRNQRNGTYLYNGIDRKDNKVGYVMDNCVPCCGICNRAKNNLSMENFNAWLIRLINFNGRKNV